jgi:chromosomal replication initiation ATPase DnaA
MNYQADLITLKAQHARMKARYEALLAKKDQEIETLRNMIINPKKIVKIEHKSLDNLMRIVCDVINVLPQEFFSRCRRQEYVLARSFFCYFANVHMKEATVKIGLYINRDHSTVIHGRNMIGDLVHIGAKYEMKLFKQIEAELNAILDNYNEEVLRINPYLS